MTVTITSKFDIGDKVSVKFHDILGIQEIVEVRHNVYQGFQYKLKGDSFWCNEIELEVDD